MSGYTQRQGTVLIHISSSLIVIILDFVTVTAILLQRIAVIPDVVVTEKVLPNH